MANGNLDFEYLASLDRRLKGLAPILPRDCIASEATEAVLALADCLTALRQITKATTISECQKIAREALGE